MTASIVIPWDFDAKISREFGILCPVNVGSLEMQEPKTESIEKQLKSFFFNHGTITAKLILPQTGYLSGRSIHYGYLLMRTRGNY